MKLDRSFAARLFDELAAPWQGQRGIDRDTFGRGEQHGFDVASRAARELGLQVDTDWAGNLYMHLPGRDPSAPKWLCGSHLDSVPAGGNFDGAAGVVAGLTVLKALRDQGMQPPRGITVMGIRGEESSSWYQGDFDSHIGSRAATGKLDPQELVRAVRIGTTRTMLDDMHELGLQLPQQGGLAPTVRPQDYMGYLELHIEQGPVLIDKGLPVGIVTGIRGSARARNAKVIGEYAHSGAVPQEKRRDAVLAAADFYVRMEALCETRRARGEDLVYACGRFTTDPARHSMTKVPGEVNFSIDVRSEDLATLEASAAELQQLAADVASRRKLRIDLGRFNLTTPARMDAGLTGALTAAAQQLGIPSVQLPSGAGHDAQDFCAAGLPCAMVFVRNDRGSHNPDEAMDLDDFILACRVLASQLLM